MDNIATQIRSGGAGKVGALLGITLAAALLAGCSGIDSPVVSLQSVRVADHSDEGARVEAVVLLHNPNDIALPLVHASYDIAVDGVGTFSYSDQTNRTLPAKGNQTVTLPAAFAVKGGDVSGKNCHVSGDIQYQPPGRFREVLTETGIPLPSSSFSQSGKLE